MAQICKSEDSLGCQTSHFTLLRSLVFLHSACQASWPPSVQGLLCLDLSSHCRRAGLADRLPHPVYVCAGDSNAGPHTSVASTSLTEPSPKVENNVSDPVGPFCVTTVGDTWARGYRWPEPGQEVKLQNHKRTREVCITQEHLAQAPLVRAHLTEWLSWSHIPAVSKEIASLLRSPPNVTVPKMMVLLQIPTVVVSIFFVIFPAPTVVILISS